MASKKGKKVINQDELRRLMREKQRQTTDKKRVESPFAKYNSLGHLSCILCNVQVKSEILWQTHVLGKPHKEKVAELKGSTQTQSTSTQKRKVLDTEDINSKKAKPSSSADNSTSTLPADFFEKPSKKEPGLPQKSAGLSLLAGVYDDEEDEDHKHEQASTTSGLQHKCDFAPSGLPADFFDSAIPSAPTVSHSGCIIKPDEPEKDVDKKENTAEALPEGFFDDPVRDAKVRKVEAPKDLMDKEWDEFQKEIRQVNTKSEAIVAEDDEDGRFERQIDEIDEQIECYRRIEVLRDKQDVVKSKYLQVNIHSEVSDEIDEEENEEELLHILARDWRAKGALA